MPIFVDKMRGAPLRCEAEKRHGKGREKTKKHDPEKRRPPSMRIADADREGRLRLAPGTVLRRSPALGFPASDFGRELATVESVSDVEGRVRDGFDREERHHIARHILDLTQVHEALGQRFDRFGGEHHLGYGAELFEERLVAHRIDGGTERHRHALFEHAPVRERHAHDRFVVVLLGVVDRHAHLRHRNGIISSNEG